MNTFFKRILTEEAEVIELFPEKVSYNDYASDTPDETNRQFINELYNAVVEKTGTTGFGFLFEKILVDNASLVGLDSPRPLNLPGAEGETNTAFADIIADGDIYYSVKCSIWDGGTPEERNITEVNASKSSSIIKLAESENQETNWSAGEYVDMKVGVITGHPSGQATASENFTKLGYVVEILGPTQNNVRIRQNPDSGKNEIVMLDASGEVVMQTRKPTAKEKEAGIVDDIEYYGIKEKPTSASAFQTKLLHESIPKTPNSGQTTLKISPFRSKESNPMLEQEMLEKLKDITVASGVSAAQRSVSGKASQTMTKAEDAALQKQRLAQLGDMSPSTIYRAMQGLNTKTARLMRGVALAKRKFAELQKLMYDGSTPLDPEKAARVIDLLNAFKAAVSKADSVDSARLAAILAELNSILGPDNAGIYIAQALKENYDNVLSLNQHESDPAFLIPMIAQRIYNLVASATPGTADAILDFIIENLESTNQQLEALSSEANVDLEGDDEEAELSMVAAEAVITLKRLLELAGLDKK